jgi:hypothetical protein
MPLTAYAKAVIGAIIAALGALGTALIDQDVTPNEWIGVALAFFVALGGVWAVPNRPQQARSDTGLSSTGIILAVVIVLVVLFLGFAVNHFLFFLLLLVLLCLFL